ncbi:hypothetical protein GDO81_002562 [Engystomops pustulosus]|uniref:Uncharacterized protein n=1 Tax=Engystomops pustulosus TaxID=76066 RepID=A0AAV7DL83_ENGPU|nr:hypothetical protein GDO81_002562 [Engystomops pustulosus]
MGSEKHNKFYLYQTLNTNTYLKSIKIVPKYIQLSTMLCTVVGAETRHLLNGQNIPKPPLSIEKTGIKCKCIYQAAIKVNAK